MIQMSKEDLVRLTKVRPWRQYVCITFSSFNPDKLPASLHNEAQEREGITSLNIQYQDMTVYASEFRQFHSKPYAEKQKKEMKEALLELQDMIVKQINSQIAYIDTVETTEEK